MTNKTNNSNDQNKSGGPSNAPLRGSAQEDGGWRVCALQCSREQGVRAMRGWSFPLGRILGVEVRLHTFFVLLLGLSIAEASSVGGIASRGVALWLALLLAIAVRESATGDHGGLLRNGAARGSAAARSADCLHIARRRRQSRRAGGGRRRRSQCGASGKLCGSTAAGGDDLRGDVAAECAGASADDAAAFDSVDIVAAGGAGCDSPAAGLSPGRGKDSAGGAGQDARVGCGDARGERARDDAWRWG